MAGGAGARMSQAGVGDSQPSPPDTPPPPQHIGKPWWSRGQASSYLRPSAASRCQARSKKREAGGGSAVGWAGSTRWGPPVSLWPAVGPGPAWELASAPPKLNSLSRRRRSRMPQLGGEPGPPAPYSCPARWGARTVRTRGTA